MLRRDLRNSQSETNYSFRDNQVEMVIRRAHVPLHMLPLPRLPQTPLLPPPPSADHTVDETNMQFLKQCLHRGALWRRAAGAMWSVPSGSLHLAASGWCPLVPLDLPVSCGSGLAMPDAWCFALGICICVYTHVCICTTICM